MILQSHTPRAARESGDNAYEAGAKHVCGIFRRASEAERGTHERRHAVAAVDFPVDGGSWFRITRRFGPRAVPLLRW